MFIKTNSARFQLSAGKTGTSELLDNLHIPDMLLHELRRNGIAVQQDLEDSLPSIRGDRVQKGRAATPLRP